MKMKPNKDILTVTKADLTTILSSSNSTFISNIKYTYNTTNSNSTFLSPLLTYSNNSDNKTSIKESISTDIEDKSKKKSLHSAPQLNKSEKTVYNRILNNDRIYIPSDVKRRLEKYTPTALLKKVHKNRKVAIEICMLFISQFTGTLLRYRNFESTELSLSSEIMISNYGKGYKNIINVFLNPFNDSPILSCDNLAIDGVKNYFYTLTPQFLQGTIKTAKIGTEEVRALRGKIISKALALVTTNVIARNSLMIYSMITLPEEKELLKIGTKMVKEKKEKKGKIYKKLGKKKRIIDAKIRYIEDDIELFKFLTSPSYLIPSTSDNAGGRVADSFTLCPTWIRNELTIGGEKLFEVDFSALHPNIASAIYGNGTAVTHEEIGIRLNIDAKVIKVEHLSFFNKEIYQMKQSPLWKFYMDTQAEMIEKICAEKASSGYKVTSRVMFENESKMMTQAITILNSEGIIPLYVYDALYGLKKDEKRIQEVMQMVADSFNIPTVAKLK